MEIVQRKVLLIQRKKGNIVFGNFDFCVINFGAWGQDMSPQQYPL